MRDRHEKSSLGAGVLTGAVAGMAIGAAAVMLSKKENRKKLRTHMNNMLDMGEERLQNAKEKLDDVRDEARSRVADNMQKVTDKLSDAQKSLEKKQKRA